MSSNTTDVLLKELLSEQREARKEIKETRQEVTEVKVELAIVAEQQKAIRGIQELLRSHDERLDNIERKPVKWWNIGVTALITGGIGALIIYFTKP